MRNYHKVTHNDLKVTKKLPQGDAKQHKETQNNYKDIKNDNKEMQNNHKEM